MSEELYKDDDEAMDNWELERPEDTAKKCDDTESCEACQ